MFVLGRRCARSFTPSCGIALGHVLATIMSPNILQLRDGLWENARDSIRHAFDHFSELRRTPRNALHDIKWIILSVHHAAECYSNIVIIDVAPDRLFQRNGRIRFPSLAEAVRILSEANLFLRISPGERRLVELFGALTEHRNLIMHRSLPDDLNASLSGMSLLGLLKICRNRTDELGWNELRRMAEGQEDLFEAISYQRIEEYCRLAEHLVREEFAGESLSYCPCCETTTIVGDRCEACFQRMVSTTCAATGERVFFPTWWQRFEDAPREVECPHCGESHALR